MKKNLLWLFLIFVACNELPIGEEQLNLREDFTAQFVEFSPYVTLTKYKNITLGASNNLILGKNSDYESRILLKFNLPDSLDQGFDEIKLILHRNNNLENSTVKFSIHLLTNSFEETQATWVKRTSEEVWSTNGGDFEPDSIRLGEINSDSLVVWFNYNELEMIKSSEGLIIIPEDTGFVGLYSKEGSIAPKFYLIKNGVVTSISVQHDCHILTGFEPAQHESWIGSGMAFRNYVKFNFDTCLTNKKAVYAELTIRPASHFGMRDTIEIGIKELLEPLEEYSTPTGPFIALDEFAVTDTLFNIDIVKHVQRIIDNPDSNFGFFIILSPENYDISNVKFLDAHHLKVGYISPPGER